MEAGGEVRRFTDDTALLRFARADQIANHDEPRGNADPARQRAGAALQLADAFDER